MTDNSLETLIRDLQPENLGNPDDLEFFLRAFLRSILRQPTHEKAGLAVDREEGVVLVEGYLPHPASCRALVAVLERTRLPNLKAGFSHASESEEAVWFRRASGRVIGRVAPFREADAAHIWEPGDPIRILREDRGFPLCQSVDGYLAWTTLEEADAALDAAEDWQAPPPNRDLVPDLDGLKKGWMGTPYLWGGTGRDGVDCSGLVMRFYQTVGLQLPRDSHQQMLCGALVAAHDHLVPMEAGDLLFFTHRDGRIGHVALSLGGWRVLHAQEGGVCEFSLDPAAPDFDAYRAEHFVFAKRLSASQSGAGR